MLDSSEWLADAQALYCGQSKRTYHGAEHRANLLIANKADRWTCWCFRCHDGGTVFKERLERELDVEKKDMPLVLVPLKDTTEGVTKRVVKFLQTKHMSLLYLKEPMWDPNRQRLVLDMQGRTLIGAEPKWLNYNGMRWVVVTKNDSRIVVLTEDLFSAYKVAYYWHDATVIAMLGTRLHKDLLAHLQHKFVVICTDADAAGAVGALQISRVLSNSGISNMIQLPPAGDPKDQEGEWFAIIRERANAACSTK